MRRNKKDGYAVLCGGYVNSELREIEERRIYDYIDCISYDEGFTDLYRTFTGKQEAPPPPSVLAPDYTDLDLDDYFSMVEIANSR